MMRVGIDVGGTFTDFVLLNDETGEIFHHKTPSSTGDPSEAIERGLWQALELFHVDAASVRFIGHGTTVGTNMVIERRGALTGLVTTRGFRDVLEIGRQTRPDVYDYTIVKPAPLAHRQHRVEVDERIDVHGNVLMALNEAQVEETLAAFRAAGVGAVAVCFLHSYRFPDHERRVAAIARRVFPEAYLSLSCDVLPEFREYERFSTTAMNAYIGPTMQGYLDRLASRVASLGIPVEPYTIHSNGGLMSIPTVRRYPVRTCLSGPAAGVIGAAALARGATTPNVITFDVGGTSTDVSMIANGRPQFTTNREVANYPVKTPMIDIHVIGAGGGSIASVDDAGTLRVGPESAGAYPGPVAYMRGGTSPTLTDANVVLGRLNPSSLLDGRMPIDRDGAERAIATSVAAPLGIDVERAAYGVLRIATSNMARAIRAVSVERGFNLSNFSLLAYGGAGPLHAVEVAMECGIGTVLVPAEPGTLCARGMLMSDVSLDFVRSGIRPLDPGQWRQVETLFREMQAEADEWLAQEGVANDDRGFLLMIDARYDGQNHEVQVELPSAGTGVDGFVERFEAAHRVEYGYALPGRGIEMVNFRVRAVGEVPKATHPAPPRKGELGEAVSGERKIFLDPDRGWATVKVYARSLVPAGSPIAGPAIIEEMSATTVVFPDQRAWVDAAGNLIIHLGAGPE